MVIYEVPAEKFDAFMKNLRNQNYRNPLDVVYNCDLKVNNDLYRLRLQVCPHRQVNPIQAVRLDKSITQCELITDPPMLETLTRLIVAQYSEGE